MTDDSRGEAAGRSQFRERLTACQERLKTAGADAAVLFPSPNMTYLSAFREEPGERHLLLFVSRTDHAFVVPSMYEDQIREASWISDLRTWADGEDPAEQITEVTEELGIDSGHLLLDDRMWTTFNHDLRETLPEATFGLASDVFDALRITKDSHELSALRSAAEVADGVSEAVRSIGEEAIGMTERELARDIEARLVDAGCERVSFEVIVGSGPNGAQPHHRHGDRTIQRGDPVVLDFGGIVDGYPGDQTRTVVFDGEPPDGFRDVHDAVHGALRAGVAAVEPGIEAQAVDHAARSTIEERGYGDAFLHRTGHGIGLEVHEEPYIVDGNDTSLRPGMVFSVEPGIYLEGEYGVRIEDIVVVTDDGAERLNDSPRTWKPL